MGEGKGAEAPDVPRRLCAQLAHRVLHCTINYEPTPYISPVLYCVRNLTSWQSLYSRELYLITVMRLIFFAGLMTHGLMSDESVMTPPMSTKYVYS